MKFLLFFIACFFSFSVLAEKASDKSSTIGQLIPPGMTMYYAGCVSSDGYNCNDGFQESVPTGWMMSYGQLISRVEYPKLFYAVGLTYTRSGDDSTKFRLPDCRGRAFVGRDNMGGTAKGLITQAGYDGVNNLTNNFGILLGGNGGLSSISDPTTSTLQTYTMPAHYHQGSFTSSGTANHTHEVAVTTSSGKHSHEVARDVCSDGEPDEEPKFRLFGTQCNPTSQTASASGAHGHGSSTITVNPAGSHSYTVSGFVGYHGAGAADGDTNISRSAASHFHTTTGSVVQPSIVMNCIIKY